MLFLTGLVLFVLCTLYGNWMPDPPPHGKVLLITLWIIGGALMAYSVGYVIVKYMP